jgi:hypothetical protein
LRPFASNSLKSFSSTASTADLCDASITCVSMPSVVLMLACCGYRKLNPAKTTSIECIAARRLRAIAKSIWA